MRRRRVALFLGVAGLVCAGLPPSALADGSTSPQPSASISPEPSSGSPTPATTGTADYETIKREIAYVVHNADGTVSLVYVLTPDPGLELVLPPDGVLDPYPLDVAPPSVAPTSVPGDSGCSYGSARGETPTGCPPIHWARSNTTHAYWYVEDHTGAAWPVYSAQITWNKSCCVGAYYAGTRCSSSYHCVPAYEGYYGAGFLGATSISYDTSHHIVSVKIYYNDSYSLTRSQHLHVTCQEQGHAMGLGHSVSSTSCMNDQTLTPTVPNSDDYGELQYEIYTH